MASSKVYFTNGVEVKKAPIGFSWTTLFFSFFVPICRFDLKWFAIQLVLALVTSGFSAFFFCFFYNKLYAKDLIYAGYKVQSIEGATIEQVRNKLGVVDIPKV